MDLPRPSARVGETFGPHPEARRLYYVYLAVPALVLAALIVVVVSTLYLAGIAEYWIVALSLAVPYLLVVVPIAYWIPKFLSTIRYTLGTDRVVYEGGVWWKRKSFVPYNRVTNIDVIQGPLSRHFGLGRVSVQTAGYSGTSGSGPRFAELSIFGVKDFDTIKDDIIGMIVKFRPMAVEAAAETGTSRLDAEMLEELKKIRKGIEELSSRQ